MADDAQIKVTTPGAKKAEGDLRKIAAAEKKVGQTGKEAGEKTKKGAEESRQAMDELGSSVGVNTRLFTSWKLGAVAAVAAIIGVVHKSIKKMQEFRREMRESYREFVDLSRQPIVTQLAQLRGKGEAETALWMRRMGEEYTLAPTDVGKAAFILESGLKPEAIGGPEAMAETQAAAFKMMRAGPATGEAAAGLAIAGFEAGIAQRPQEFKALYAKVVKSTQGALVDPGKIAGILGRLLPMAVANGIDANYFIAMACAMSFRIPDPGRLASTLERLIRAAGKKGPALEKYAEQMGRDVSDLGAVEVMEFHSRILTEAMKRGGPQAAALVAERLGLAGEEVTSYAAAFDPKVQARMRGIMGGTADWETVIGGRYRKVRETPESKVYAARLRGQTQKYISSRQYAYETEVEEWAKGEVARMMAAGEDIPGVWESIAGPKDAKYALMRDRLFRELGRMADDQTIPESARREARRLGLEMSIGDVTSYKTSRGFMLIQNNFHGGTQNINQNKVDPAGKPRPARRQN